MKKTKGFLLLHLSVFIAGFTGVLGRLIELDSVVLVWHRMAWAAALMVLFLLFRKELKRYRLKDLLQMGGVGVLLCLHWIFFYASIKASNVSIGVVCFSLVGFFTALFEPIINKHRFSIKEFLFSILTVCGVYLIFQFDTRYRLGIALGIVSSALYALFAIANQHVGKHYEAKNMLLWEMIGGLVVLSAIIPIYNALAPVEKLLPAGLDYPYMAFMVIVCTIGLCLLQIIVLQKIDAFTVNLTYNLEPVYSIILAMLLFNEYQELNFSFILGIALIIISVVLQTWSKLKTTLLLALVTLPLCVWAQPVRQCSSDTLTRTVVYQPGDYGSTNYRIPAIITADDGSLVIATDKRKYNNNDLPEDIDILINRSTDGGRTWSEPFTLAQGQGVGKGFGDCALVRTNNEGGLLAAFVGGCGFWQGRPENPLRTYIARSNDNGQTWTKPKDITDEIYGANCPNEVSRTWWSAFFASGNGLRTSTGRIMFVLAVRDTEEWAACNYVVYSDDNGETWQISGRASQRGDEAKVVELTDGRLLMSIRHEGERWYNLSEDGGLTWQAETSAWSDLVATACDGDIIRYPSKEKSILLHSLPAPERRENVTIYVSYDEGKTWPVSKCIVPYNSAYSSLCVLPDGTIGFYVEEADDGTTNYSMVFYHFSLDWLTQGKP